VIQLLVVGGHLPELAQLAESGDASPRDCYRVLGALAAGLCALAGDDPTALPRFSHADLRATFVPLFARIHDLLRPFRVASYEVVPLEDRGGGVYLSRLEAERLLRAQLFLTVASDQPEARVAEQIPRLCKISSSAKLVELQRRALPGLELQIVHRPPPQLPLRPGVYFSLVRQGPHWEHVVAERNLALYLPPPFDAQRTRIELLAIRAAGGDPDGARAR
jgi:type VI secretion system protein ImpJ